MIEKETLDFLNDLAMHNNREWFHQNKLRYDAAKQNIIDITVLLTAEIGKFDSSIRPFDPKKGMFRIARDIRFSTNKDPYKLNLGACINPLGRNIVSCSTYYINIQPGACFVSAGVYMPDKDSLQDIRYHIYNNFDRFSEILNNKEFKEKVGGLADDPYKLKRVPNNFDKTHPAAEFMKYKNHYVCKFLSDDLMMDNKKAFPLIVDIYRVMEPFNTFINEAFSRS